MKKIISITGICIILLVGLGYFLLITRDTLKKESTAKAENIELLSITENEIRYTAGTGSYLSEKNLGGSTANVTKNISDYDSLFKKYALLYNQQCTMLKAIMYAESSGNTKAQSSLGGTGLTGLMFATAKEFGVRNEKDLFIPKIAIETTAAYLARLEETACAGEVKNEVCSAHNIKYLIAAYSSGNNSNVSSENCQNKTIWQCGTNDQYTLVKNYVERVIANYNKLKKNDWGC